MLPRQSLMVILSLQVPSCRKEASADNSGINSCHQVKDSARLLEMLWMMWDETLEEMMWNQLT